MNAIDPISVQANVSATNVKVASAVGQSHNVVKTVNSVL